MPVMLYQVIRNILIPYEEYNCIVYSTLVLNDAHTKCNDLVKANKHKQIAYYVQDIELDTETDIVM